MHGGISTRIDEAKLLHRLRQTRHDMKCEAEYTSKYIIILVGILWGGKALILKGFGRAGS
jgi:hypothetical protein